MCSAHGCEKPVLARGFCGTHYARFRRHGTIEKDEPGEIPPHIRPIAGYEGYFCDQSGVVYSNRRKGRHLDKFGPLKPITMRRRKDGYLQVHFRGDSPREAPLVHQVVIQTWGEPQRLGHVINHKNGKKDDNRIENLEWVTQKQNIRHAIEVLKRDFRRKPTRD